MLIVIFIETEEKKQVLQVRAILVHVTQYLTETTLVIFDVITRTKCSPSSRFRQRFRSILKFYRSGYDVRSQVPNACHEFIKLFHLL